MLLKSDQNILTYSLSPQSVAKILLRPTDEKVMASTLEKKAREFRLIKSGSKDSSDDRGATPLTNANS